MRSRCTRRHRGRRRPAVRLAPVRWRPASTVRQSRCAWRASAALIGSCATATGAAFGAALFWPVAPSAIQRLISAICSDASGLLVAGGITSSSPSGGESSLEQQAFLRLAREDQIVRTALPRGSPPRRRGRVTLGFFRARAVARARAVKDRQNLLFEIHLLLRGRSGSGKRHEKLANRTRNRIQGRGMNAD